MGDVVNLKRFKKRSEREASAKQAETNRARFGRSKSARELDEARATARAGLALQPDFTLRRYRENALSDSPAYLAGRERSCKGMRMAGVPEG